VLLCRSTPIVNPVPTIHTQSGQLKPSELVKVFAQIGIAEVSEEQVADMMKAFDINHSGTLTYEEFQRMVMSFERSE